MQAFGQPVDDENAIFEMAEQPFRATLGPGIARMGRAGHGLGEFFEIEAARIEAWFMQMAGKLGDALVDLTHFGRAATAHGVLEIGRESEPFVDRGA